MLPELATYFRYTAALPRFLAHRLGAAEAEELLLDSIARRAASFLEIVDRGIYARPASPYRQLLRWAGVELGDVRTLVRDEGLEGALGALYDAGVFVSIDELKGRRGIERPGLSIAASSTAFDNPLQQRHHDAQSSGSRGARTRAGIDLALLEHEAAYVHQFLDAFDLWHRPYAVWRPVPPAAAGLKWLLRLERLGKPLDRWFSQTRHSDVAGGWRYGLVTGTTVAGGRALGRRFPCHSMCRRVPLPR